MLQNLVVAGLMATAALAAQLQQVQYPNKAKVNVPMFIYVPDNVVPSPALVVVLHSCQSSAQAYFQNALIPWHGGSDGKGYITLWPSSPHSNCWDTSSRQSLVRDGGGDSQAIANMIEFAIAEYGADAAKVFVTGGSSGGMMANVLAATYPDLIAAVSLYSGTPAGCFADPAGGVDVWNSTCSSGRSTATAQRWGDVARAMYPGYDGPRPRMQLWHGTADTTLAWPNYQEEIKQWTDVMGVGQTPSQTRKDWPQSGYTTDDYGDAVEGIWAQGVGHSVPANLTASEAWFGL